MKVGKGLSPEFISGVYKPRKRQEAKELILNCDVYQEFVD
jgi:hypothetical protein